MQAEKLHFEYLGLTLPSGKEHPWDKFRVCDHPTATSQDGKADFVANTKNRKQSENNHHKETEQVLAWFTWLPHISHTALGMERGSRKEGQGKGRAGML